MNPEQLALLSAIMDRRIFGARAVEQDFGTTIKAGPFGHRIRTKAAMSPELVKLSTMAARRQAILGGGTVMVLGAAAVLGGLVWHSRRSEGNGNGMLEYLKLT